MPQLSPEAVGDACDEGEQGQEHHRAGCDGHVLPLLLLSPLELQPLQVTELAALPHVPRHTAATDQTTIRD